MREMQTPFYEGFISKHFPAWGARRTHWRMQQSVQASFREGIATRTSETFNLRNLLSTQSISDRRSLQYMRARSRKAYRENPIARGLINVELDNVVSHGMTLQAQTGNKAFDDEAEDRFANWLDNADLRGMMDGTTLQRMTWKTARVDGDAGLVLVSSGSGQNATSKLQLITGDLICNPDSKGLSPLFIDGVETNSFGAIVAFHVLDQDEWGKRKWQRVDARDFVFFPHVNEAFDVRGTPCYATVFDLLNNLEQYVDGVALAAWMATVFGIIFKEDNAGKQVAGLGMTANSQGNQQKALTLENGMIKFTGPNSQTVQVDAKQPMQQTPDFIRMMLRLIGVPFDMPLELVLKDVSQSNLSSLRGGIQAFQRACKAKQAVYAGPNQWGKVYRWWVSRERNLGNFISEVPPNFFDHEWMFHGWEFTDPLKEAQSALLEIDMGIDSEENVCQRLGRDYDQILEQKAEAKAKREALGLQDVSSSFTRDPLAPVDPNAPAPTDGATNE